jgi:hypothetical protein
MTILAIDPGPETSGYALWNGRIVEACATDLPNLDMLARVESFARGAVPAFGDCLAIERVACYGAPVGDAILETVFWSGRFAERWAQHTTCPVVRMRFGEVALHHCLSRRSKESHIRQALIDRFGVPGTKATPGLLYRVHGHAWSSLALAVAVADQAAATTDKDCRRRTA